MMAIFHLYDYEREGHFLAKRKRQLPISFLVPVSGTQSHLKLIASY